MKQVDMYKRVALLALMGVSLAGCSTVKGWFAGKDAAAKKAQEPAELVDFESSVKVDKLWSTGVGKGEGHIGVRQRPAVADGKVYAAAITAWRAGAGPADRQARMGIQAQEGRA